MDKLFPTVAALSIGSVALASYATLHRNAPIFGEVLARLPPEAQEVALTFDDGPNPEATPRLLDLLAQQDAKATFFLLGRHVRQWPAIARRVAEEGHLVANHGYAHRRLDFAGPRRVREDILAGTGAIADATGIEPAHFRAPHGARSPFVTPVARSLGQRTVGWSVGSRDHAELSAARIARRVEERARAGSIVLLHDGDAYNARGNRVETVLAVARIIPFLRTRALALALLPR